MRIFTLVLLLLLLALAAPALAEEAMLIKVIDGDSLVLTIHGLPVEVRLLGIDAPEYGQEWGEEATEFVEDWTEHQVFDLEYGPTKTDRFNRLLAWFWRSDGHLLNEDLVQNGLAIPFMLKKEDKHFQRIHTAQAKAKAAQSGFWSQGGLKKTPQEWRRLKQ
ncbi:MAG: thermonuclease family protein [Proteobacteria bacterium]|nr:thermonuclease family protein [Pseudomonadota bacterium]